VLRVYHAGRDADHRRRERALVAAGVDLTLVVPDRWPDPGAQEQLSAEPFGMVELAVRRAGDVNRHAYDDPKALSDLVAEHRPDVIDLHEEPFSLAARQWLRAAGDIPVLMYTAQNLDKRFPPPFAQYEQRALRQVKAMYPCSRQAASVARGKGFGGQLEVLPLGYDSDVYGPGQQVFDDDPVVLGIVGRLVPEKGVLDAVRVLAAVRARRPAILHIVGQGPQAQNAVRLAAELGVADGVRLSPWMSADAIAALYQTMHVLLIPSRASETWVEQFGRVIPEAQASGAVVAGYASGAIAEVAGAHGILVDEGDQPGLATAVVNLLESSESWNARRKGGLAQAISCTWTSIAERQAGLYHTVANDLVRRTTVPLRQGRARAAACAEFGSAAVTARSARPMALPVLRKLPKVESGLGLIIDLAGDCRALLK
jgi:glycosyltransferase involved in cell wall biosynthesis